MNNKLCLLSAQAVLCVLLALTGCKEKDEPPTNTESKAPIQSPVEQTAQPPSAATQPPSTSTSKKKSLVFTAKDFSIAPPAGWEQGKPNDQAFMIFLDAPKNNFRANFNVNVSTDDGTPVNKIGSLIKPMFAKQFDQWKAMGEGTTTIGGQQAYFLSSRFKMQGYDIQNLQYYIRGKSKRFYVLTFTALSSNYKSYEATFKQTATTVQTL